MGSNPQNCMDKYTMVVVEEVVTVVVVMVKVEVIVV